MQTSHTIHTQEAVIRGAQQDRVLNLEKEPEMYTHLANWDVLPWFWLPLPPCVVAATKT